MSTQTGGWGRIAGKGGPGMIMKSFFLSIKGTVKSGYCQKSDFEILFFAH